jgi:large subunit ribosomal protein L10
MERTLKNAELEYLQTGFAKSPLALCADYRGLTVAQITNLRIELKKTGAHSKVVKNTLAKISAKKALGEGASADELGKLLEMFKGPSLLIFAGDDIVSPAKVLIKLEKEYNALEVKGGWFEGSYVDKNGVNSISAMPSREELLSGLLRVINGPATQLARIVQAPGQQLAQVISAYKDTLAA